MQDRCVVSTIIERIVLSRRTIFDGKTDQDFYEFVLDNSNLRNSFLNFPFVKSLKCVTKARLLLLM